jgi:glycosyltransferase involved in cell wall biosynthesis
MTPRPRISVVMPMRDNAPQLRVTVPAILNQTLPEGIDYEVVAVDDGSGPEVGALLSTLENPRLRVVRLSPNRGRSGARNAGIAAARGDWIVLLDSDVIVRSDFLAGHAEVLGAGAGISLGRVIDTDRLDPADSRPVPPRWPGPANFTTANAAVRRDLLDAASDGPDGPFDAATFTRYGWEDLELDTRLSRLSPVRRRAPRAIGYHICPPFAPELIPAMIAKEIERAEMARRYLAKHPTLAVRLTTQTTPLHRALWEALSLGGLLNERTLRPLLGWLARHDRRGLAAVIARNLILNPTYVRHL